MILSNTKEYLPVENEDYMNNKQLDYFRDYLAVWRSELVDSNQNLVQSLKEFKLRKPDLIDQSATHSEMVLDVSAGERQHQLICEIDNALSRIEEGEYGYCEVTGEEIGLRRLLARPVATMCVDIQEYYESVAHRSGKCAVPLMM